MTNYKGECQKVFSASKFKSRYTSLALSSLISHCTYNMSLYIESFFEQSFQHNR